MIRLYKFPSVWGVMSPSPFCMKLEVYLKMANIAFEPIACMDPRQSPKGKLPFIIDNGQKIADSGLIIDALKRRLGDSHNPDKALTPTQYATGRAIQRLLEEHLYWVMMYNRWVDEQGWSILKETFFGKLPIYKRGFIASIIKRNVVKALHFHGMGRHQRDEIYAMGVDTITVIETLLGEGPYIFGEAPTSIDACIYSYVANFSIPPFESPVKVRALASQALGAHCERMQNRYQGVG